MGRTLFNSTLREKKDLYERLERALPNDDIEAALRVVEDAMLVHDFHTAVGKVEESFQAMETRFAVNPLIANHIGKIAFQEWKESVANLDRLYKKIEKKKKKSRRS